MKTIDQFPRPVREIENCWIPLADGCRLAARIWLPEDAERDPVPAILEYLPYRKRDGTAVRDQLTHPYFAGHGYASIRVDMRGNGESDGLMWDEYLKQEQDDAIEVIAWIAAQPWCTGKVGMIGISWGGFNGLQVAMRRPRAAEGRGLDLLDRRPLCRRHPLQGRLPARRESGLVLDHVRLLLAPAGSRARRRALARDVARAAGERAAAGRALARPPAARRVLGAWLALRGLRVDRGGGARRRRLGRRLSQRAAAARSPTSKRPARRSSAPGCTNIRISRCPARGSASCRNACAGGTSG